MQPKIVWNGRSKMRLLRTPAYGACLCDILPHQLLLAGPFFRMFGFVAFLLFAQQPPAFKFFIFSGKSWKFLLGRHRFRRPHSWMRFFLLQLLCCRDTLLDVQFNLLSFRFNYFQINLPDTESINPNDVMKIKKKLIHGAFFLWVNRNHILLTRYMHNIDDLKDSKLII